MPSLPPSSPSWELELQLSSKLLINGEKATANVDAATMPIAAAPTEQNACLDSDIAYLSMLLPVCCRILHKAQSFEDISEKYR